MVTLLPEGSLDPVATAPGSATEDGWIVRAQSSAEFCTDWLVGADGANSAIAKKLAGPLPAAEMEVAFGYRAPLPVDGEAATVVAFLPKWVGYAWAFPRIDHISFGIATTQDAFDHDSLDALMWDFMVAYYEVGSYRTGSGSDRINGSTMRIWKRTQSVESPAATIIRKELKQTAE